MPHDGGNLQQPVAFDQPQMLADDPDTADGGVKLSPDCAARLKPWQINIGGLNELSSAAQQHGIAVPSKRSCRPAERGNTPARGFDHVLRQGGGARRHAFISFLQNYNFSAQSIDHLQAAVGAAAQIKADAFLQVIGCNSDRMGAHIQGCNSRIEGGHQVFSDQTGLARAIWLLLLGIVVWAMVQLRWEIAFVAFATMVLSMIPVFIGRWAHIAVPPSFVAAVVLFVGGTLFLGESFNFYERFWWWDIVMHGGSAIGFGLIGFILVFMMFQGDRFAAPHFAIAFFAFCFAVSIGVMWEVFEFTMDQSFGLTMQKSGLMDTMGDLMVDQVGAIIGATAGYAYLKGAKYGGLTGIIDEFVRRNPRFFRRRK